jgi:N4-(beta-N-acetylglucosaminyl)-L-asparaginase
MKQIVISTWKFSLPAAETAWRLLSEGKPVLDAVEEGIAVCENDPEIDSVGLGGLPDAAGNVTLDASIMDHAGRCGAVACLSRTRNPIRVARRVMERTPHVLLVGTGADQFARSQGFAEMNLLTPRSAEKYAEWKRRQTPAVQGHDTIGLLALDSQGVLAGGCSTSGMAFKMPGRVGDSPIIGAGLYVDGKVGAASATGVGEEAIRIFAAASIVDQLFRGDDPIHALTHVMRNIVPHIRKDRTTDMSFIALRADGATAGLSFRVATKFQYVMIDDAGPRVIDSRALLSAD